MSPSDQQDPTQPVLVKQVDLSWQAQVADILKKQGPITLFAVVAVYFMWMQINANAAAYEVRQKEREALHAQVIEKLAAQQTVQLKDLADTFGREQDRTERILGNKINLNARRVSEVEKKVGLMP